MPYAFGSVYNASKAALHSYSDTLRIELAPFDVKVVTIVTGGVISNISRTHRTLPEGSLYRPLAKEYEERQTHSQANGIPNEQYAASVVRQVLDKPSRDTIWKVRLRIGPLFSTMINVLFFATGWQVLAGLVHKLILP